MRPERIILRKFGNELTKVRNWWSKVSKWSNNKLWALHQPSTCLVRASTSLTLPPAIMSPCLALPLTSSSKVSTVDASLTKHVPCTCRGYTFPKDFIHKKWWLVVHTSKCRKWYCRVWRYLFIYLYFTWVTLFLG